MEAYNSTLFIRIFYNIAQRANNFFRVRKVIGIIRSIGLDILSCRIFCTRDNIDIKVILINRKLITNSLDLVLDSKLAIGLAV